MPTVPETRLKSNAIFISYSHSDKRWLNRLKLMLKPLTRIRQNFIYWDDRKIAPGFNWREEIEQALASCRVAVLLVSPSFLASDFIAEHELPYIVSNAAAGELTIIWVYLSACRYDITPIAGYQAGHDVSQPLDTLTPAKRNQALSEVTKSIESALALHDIKN